MSVPVQENLSGPHLQIAAFCEKVLVEADQVPSLIRIVERFTVSGPSPELTPTTLTFFLVISIKSGFVKGKHPVRIIPVTPNGVEKPTIEVAVFLEGDDRGALIAAQMTFLAEEEGLYWFRVYFDQALMTQMPLRVMYQRIASVQVGNG